MAGGILQIDYSQTEKLQQAMQAYQGNTEEVINDVLHNFAGDRAQEAIYRLMPRSDKKKGKHARESKSLSNVTGNLAVTVTAKGKWNYLYFPDDGTNTQRHIGNQQFFKRGGDAVLDEIIERCITKLTTEFEKGV